MRTALAAAMLFSCGPQRPVPEPRPVDEGWQRYLQVRKQVESQNPLPSAQELEAVQRLHPEMVWVPQGSFLSGEAAVGGDGAATEDPPWEVLIVEGFLIDRTMAASPSGAGVSLQHARRACAAQGKRLCSAVEWEKACKGPRGLVYAYGDQYVEDCGSSAQDGPACASGYGASGMSSGTAEWTVPANDPMERSGIAKGGGRSDPQLASRCAHGDARATAGDLPGFRCCLNHDSIGGAEYELLATTQADRPGARFFHFMTERAVYRLPLDGGKPQRLLDLAAGERVIAAAAGRVVSTREGGLLAWNGGERRQIPTSVRRSISGYHSSPATPLIPDFGQVGVKGALLSPDGTQVAWNRCSEDDHSVEDRTVLHRHEVFVSPLTGGEPRLALEATFRIPYNQSHGSRLLRWTPAGSIWFESYEMDADSCGYGPSVSLSALSPDSGEVVDYWLGDTALDVSSDDRRVALMSLYAPARVFVRPPRAAREQEALEVFNGQLELGQEPEEDGCLPEAAEGIEQALFSPDGRYLALILRDRQGHGYQSTIRPSDGTQRNELLQGSCVLGWKDARTAVLARCEIGRSRDRADLIQRVLSVRLRDVETGGEELLWEGGPVEALGVGGGYAAGPEDG